MAFDGFYLKWICFEFEIEFRKKEKRITFSGCLFLSPWHKPSFRPGPAHPSWPAQPRLPPAWVVPDRLGPILRRSPIAAPKTPRAEPPSLSRHHVGPTRRNRLLPRLRHRIRVDPPPPLRVLVRPEPLRPPICVSRLPSGFCIASSRRNPSQITEIDLTVAIAAAVVRARRPADPEQPGAFRAHHRIRVTYPKLF